MPRYRLRIPGSLVPEPVPGRTRGVDASDVGIRAGAHWPEELEVDGRVYEYRHPLRDAWGEFAGMVYASPEGEQFEVYND